MSWYENRGSSLEKELRSGSVVVVVGAIRELAGHALHRHELAARLSGLIDHRDPNVRSIVISALGQLESGAALPALRQCLEDEDGGNSDAVEALIRRLLSGNSEPQAG